MSTLAIQEPIKKKFNGNVVELYPSDQHEFVMDSAQVSKGFDCSKSTIWNHRKEHSDELLEGKHYYYSTLRNPDSRNLKTKKLYWTKRGIIRLGFFLRSQRAKQFRDWAEDLILKETQPKHKALGKGLKLTEKQKLMKGEVRAYDLRRIGGVCRMFHGYLYFGALYGEIEVIRTNVADDIFTEDVVVEAFRKALREVKLPCGKR